MYARVRKKQLSWLEKFKTWPKKCIIINPANYISHKWLPYNKFNIE